MSCSCNLDRAAGDSSSSGWHFRKLGDLGCFQSGHSRIEDGKEVCNRGSGIHNCKATKQRCIYAGADVAVEPCPRYRIAVEQNIGNERLRAHVQKTYGRGAIFEED